MPRPYATLSLAATGDTRTGKGDLAQHSRRERRVARLLRNGKGEPVGRPIVLDRPFNPGEATPRPYHPLDEKNKIY